MPPVANLTHITVTGRYVMLDGTIAQGSVAFTPQLSTPLIDAAARNIVIPTKFVAVLDATGAFTISLPATDDPDFAPTNFNYRVDEVITGGAGRTFFIDLPSSDPTVDLSEIAPSGTALTPVLNYATVSFVISMLNAKIDLTARGAANGVAALDATGKVPAAQLPPSSGGSGTTDHGALTGLADDDHPQYLNNARGDDRYYTKQHIFDNYYTRSQSDSNYYDKVTADGRYATYDFLLAEHYTKSQVDALVAGIAQDYTVVTVGTGQLDNNGRYLLPTINENRILIATTNFMIEPPDGTNATSGDVHLVLVQDGTGKRRVRLSQAIAFPDNNRQPYISATPNTITYIHLRWLGLLGRWVMLEFITGIPPYEEPIPATYQGVPTYLTGSTYRHYNQTVDRDRLLMLMTTKVASTIRQWLQTDLLVYEQSNTYWDTSQTNPLTPGIWGYYIPGATGVTSRIVTGTWMSRSGNPYDNTLHLEGDHFYLHELAHAVDFQWIRRTFPSGYTFPGNGQVYQQLSLIPTIVNLYAEVVADLTVSRANYGITGGRLEWWAEMLSYRWMGSNAALLGNAGNQTRVDAFDAFCDSWGI